MFKLKRVSKQKAEEKEKKLMEKERMYQTEWFRGRVRKVAAGFESF